MLNTVPHGRHSFRPSVRPAVRPAVRPSPGELSLLQVIIPNRGKSGSWAYVRACDYFFLGGGVLPSFFGGFL